MKTTKDNSSQRKNKRTPKSSQPKPITVIHPSPLITGPPSTTNDPQNSDAPRPSKMHAGTKRPNTNPKSESSSKTAKRLKQADPNSAEEIAKEMTVGFGLDKHWYDSTPFPQLHAILQNQCWETLMTDYCCNHIYPSLMREFISNFSIENEVCSSVVKEIKIEFNSLILGEWFGVPAVGFDTYYVGSKIVFSGINEKTVLKFLGINEKKGRISHNLLSPLHKLLYNIARRFILPRSSKRSEVNLRDATLIYCLANHIKINFPSLMISHLSYCIEKKYLVGYGGLLTWIFRKFGVPLNGLKFPKSPKNKIGAKCLNNLHLKLNDNGILENANAEVEVVDSEKDEEEQEDDKVIKDQETVPNATQKEVEAGSQGEQGEADKEGEASKKEEGAAVDLSDVNDSDEEVQMPVQKEPVVTPRKSRRLASKGKRRIASLDDDSSHTSLEPQSTAPSPPKPFTSPTHHIPSLPPSPIRATPPPVTSQDSPPHTPTGLGSVPILSQLKDLQSQLYAFQSEVRVSLASITDQLTQMEARLGAKLGTVEVQTEFIDDEEQDP